MGYDKIVLLIVVATSFMTPVMGSALNIAIPSIGREFSASATMLSWIATGYILATASCLLPAGRFADRVQELHIKVIHILIELIEAGMAEPNPSKE